MPVQLRRFYLQKLISIKEEEKKEMEKANKPKSSSIQKPSFVPRRR